MTATAASLVSATPVVSHPIPTGTSWDSRRTSSSARIISPPAAATATTTTKIGRPLPRRPPLPFVACGRDKGPSWKGDRDPTWPWIRLRGTSTSPISSTTGSCASPTPISLPAPWVRPHPIFGASRPRMISWPTKVWPPPIIQPCSSGGPSRPLWWGPVVTPKAGSMGVWGSIPWGTCGWRTRPTTACSDSRRILSTATSPSLRRIWSWGNPASIPMATATWSIPLGSGPMVRETPM